MTKKIVIFAALMSFCGGAFAQDAEVEEEEVTEEEEVVSSGGGFLSGMTLNTNNKFQITLLLGNAGLFNQDLNYVAPRYADKEIGLPSPGADAKEQAENHAIALDPGFYIDLNNLGEGSIVNMAGISFAYYIADGLDVNLSFGMDLRSTPKKNYVEDEDFNGMTIQGSKWIEGRLKNNWVVSAGANYHFIVSNEKVDLFAGIRAGYQHGQITVTTPYTDKDYAYLTNLYADDPVKAAEAEKAVLYFPRSGAGQVHCITGSIIAGVNYSLTKGLLLGLEFEPYSYRYNLLQVIPTGGAVYQAVNYDHRFFASPMLKLGFRF